MKIINPKIFFTIWIYLGWFGCVYFGKLDWSIASFIFPLISWILMQITFQLKSQQVLRLVILLFIGLVFDAVGVYFGLIKLYPPTQVSFLPLWLIALWLLFISSLPLMQSLFQKKYILASVLGAIFGLLSYRAGGQFGTLEINGWIAHSIYGVFWATYIPAAICWLERKDLKYENT